MHYSIYKMAATALANVDKKKATAVAAGMVASIASNSAHAGLRRAAEVAAAALNNGRPPTPKGEAIAFQPQGGAAAGQTPATSVVVPDPAISAAMLASAHAQANSWARRVHSSW